MSTINNGGQVLVFDYKQKGTSQGFNRLLYKVLPVGVLSGGELVKVTDASITISPLVAIFEDTASNVAVRIETTENATVGVSASAPYIIAKFKWLNVEENFVEFSAVQYSKGIEDEGIILGKCIYKGSVLSGFDYTRKNWSQDHFYNKDYLDFNVTPNEPENKTINIGKGNAIIGGKQVEFKGTNVTINTNVSQKRIDLVSINKDGKVVVTEGIQSEKPETPIFPANMLTVAIINLPSNPTAIKGDMITNLYSSNFIQSSENFKISEIISKATTVNNVTEDTKYILNNKLSTLTLNSATYLGCRIQVLCTVDGGAKLALKSPNKIYKLVKGEYVNIIWDGTQWIDLNQSTSWDLRNVPDSIPLSANMNDYTHAGTWKNNKMTGIKEIPDEITKAEESADDHNSYSTIIVEEGEGWVKQFIFYANTTTSGSNGSGHYLVVRGGLRGSDGRIQGWTQWSKNVSEDELLNGVIKPKLAGTADLAKTIADGSVTTSKIVDGNVTTSKIANDNVTEDKLANTIVTKLSNSVSHIANKSNPHGVTKSQVGLGSVDNKSFASIKAEILLATHPVGSYYWSTVATNPSTLFGGTWVQIKDKFIFAQGDSGSVGATGGAKTHKIGIDNLPPHTHSIIHTHDINDPGHYHDIPSGWNRVESGIWSIDANNHSSLSGGTISEGGKTNITIQKYEGSSGDGGFSNTALDTMPPYETAYCWKRTK